MADRLKRLVLALYVLLNLAAGLAALVIIGQRGYCVLFCSLSDSTARIPVCLMVHETHDTSAVNLQIECASTGNEGVRVTTDPQGRAKCLLPVTSAKKFFGVSCVQRTYNTLGFDAYKLATRQVATDVGTTRSLVERPQHGRDLPYVDSTLISWTQLDVSRAGLRLRCFPS